MTSSGKRLFRAAVAGAGALGNEIFRQLGLLGAGEVVLIDPDRVEPSNRAKCAFFRAPGAAGRPKVQVLAETGREWFPETRWIAVEREIADVGWSLLKDCEVLFGCVDRDSARLEMARIATRLDVPVCDGGMSTADAAAGRVTWFPGRGGACFCCRLTARTRRQFLETWSSAAHPCHVPQEPGGWSATPALAAVTAALQVHCAAGWLAAGEREAQSVEFRLQEPLRLHRFRVPLDDSCPFHTPPPPLFPVEGPLEKVLRPGRAIEWEWPICLRARCLDCGAQCEPRMRVTLFRRRGACPRCGGPRLLELDNRRRIAFGDSMATKTPEDLGLPAEHLYSIREGSPVEEME